MKPHELNIHFLCTLLDLPKPPSIQGWEREMASAELLPRLLDQLPKEAWEVPRIVMFAELLIGSLDDALMRGFSIEVFWPKAKRFIEANEVHLREVIEYWIGEDEAPEDRFYVAALLEQGEG